MLKKRIASILLASVIATGCTSFTAFAEETVTSTGDGAFRAGGKKAAAYCEMKDGERAELRGQIFSRFTDDQKNAIIEKMGCGKGAGLGTNAKGNKALAFDALTDEERAAIKSQVFSKLTDEQKSAIIEKMGGGKGAGSGINHKRANAAVAQ